MCIQAIPGKGLEPTVPRTIKRSRFMLPELGKAWFGDGRTGSRHFNQISTLEHQYRVAVLNGAEPVGNYEGRSTLHQSLHGFNDSCFGGKVDRARRLVQDEERS